MALWNIVSLHTYNTGKFCRSHHTRCPNSECSKMKTFFITEWRNAQCLHSSRSQIHDMQTGRRWMTSRLNIKLLLIKSTRSLQKPLHSIEAYVFFVLLAPFVLSLGQSRICNDIILDGVHGVTEPAVFCNDNKTSAFCNVIKLAEDQNISNPAELGTKKPAVHCNITILLGYLDIIKQKYDWVKRFNDGTMVLSPLAKNWLLWIFTKTIN